MEGLLFIQSTSKNNDLLPFRIGDYGSTFQLACIQMYSGNDLQCTFIRNQRYLKTNNIWHRKSARAW